MFMSALSELTISLIIFIIKQVALTYNKEYPNTSTQRVANLVVKNYANIKNKSIRNSTG